MTSRLHTYLYTYPWTLHQQGVAEGLRTIRDRGGLDAISVPFQYHSALIVEPHSFGSRVRYTEQTASHHFVPETSRYEGGAIQPLPTELALAEDPMRAIRDGCREEGLGFIAWVVALHGSVLGGRHPELVQRSVYGDPLRPGLCPAHPEVRDFLATLLQDIAVNYEPDVIELESLEFLPFLHGYHHELLGIGLDPYHETLLGLDFHPETLAAIAARGVDVEYVANFVRTTLDRFFASEAEEGVTDLEHFPRVLIDEPELAAFMRARLDIIIDLAAHLREAVQAVSSIPLQVLTECWHPLHLSWIEGQSPERLLDAVDLMAVPFYFETPQEGEREAATLRRRTSSVDRVVGAINSIPPHTTSEQQQREMVDVITGAGIDKLSFYNYSLIRPERLDWIRDATRP